MLCDYSFNHTYIDDANTRTVATAYMICKIIFEYNF